MPKIVINEIDKTTPGTPEYSNFAVVVPGFCKADVDPDLFDENGIYECASREDFVNNVGICQHTMTFLGAETLKEATAPAVKLIYRYDEAASIQAGTNRLETQEDFEGQDTKVTVYTYNTPEDFTAALNAAKASTNIYTATANTTGEIGLLKTSNYVFHAVSGAASGAISALAVDGQVLSTVRTASFDTSKDYYELGSLGNDTEYNDAVVTHYGNQIAYELLGLGYPVLYKAIWLSKDLIKLAAPTIELVDANDLAETRGVAEALAANNVITTTEDSADAEISVLQDYNFWSCLEDKAAYDFRYVVSGLLDKAEAVNTQVCTLAMRRQDCIALVDIDTSVYAGKTQAEAIAPIAEFAQKFGKKSEAEDSKYVALFAPCVTYNLAKNEYINATFPGYFHYLACAAAAADKFAEWYAVAGYTRGFSGYTIASTGCKFGETAIQALEPRTETAIGTSGINTTVAVNLIVKIKNSYYLWGNRTGHKLNSDGLVASHFLNIRQLCTTIKKQVYVACRRLTFDPNSTVLWLNFRSRIEPLLKRMKADQGIKDYKLVPVAAQEKGKMKAQIHIVPIEAVEDFTIDLVLTDALGEGTVEMTEV